MQTRKTLVKKHRFKQSPSKKPIDLIQILLILVIGISIVWIALTYQTKEIFRLTTTAKNRVHSFLIHFTSLPTFTQQTKKKITPSLAQIPPATTETPPIYFEFYRTLTHTEESPIATTTIPSVTIHTPHPLLAKESKKNITLTHTQTMHNLHPHHHPLPLTNLADLEKDLYQHLQSIVYILELNQFSSYESAKQYQKQLLARHIITTIVRLSLSHKMDYSIQVGPFFSYHQALFKQTYLKKMEITGKLKKLHFNRVSINQYHTQSNHPQAPAFLKIKSQALMRSF